MNLSDVKAGLINASASINRKLKEMNVNGKDRTTLLLNKIVELAPVVDLIGFNMKELLVQGGIPESATVIFLKERDVDPATIEAILKENEDNDLLALLVRALQKGETLQKRLRLSNYLFSSIHLKLGVPPEVSLRFLRVDKSELVYKKSTTVS